MTMSTIQRPPSDFRKLVVFVWLGAVLSAGCGSGQPERASINGKVTYQGKPVDFGFIVFVPLNRTDKFYSQATITQGSYSLAENGPVVGENRVEIHGHRKTGRKAPDIDNMRLDQEAKMIEVTEPYLPLKYNVASELKIDIQAGANDNVDFHLE